MDARMEHNFDEKLVLQLFFLHINIYIYIYGSFLFVLFIAGGLWRPKALTRQLQLISGCQPQAQLATATASHSHSQSMWARLARPSPP